jgi:hypothetical protein
MTSSRDSNNDREALLEQNLARLIRSALAVEAPPMSTDQVRAVIREAAARIRPAAAFPPWAIAALAACVVALVCLACSLPQELPLSRILLYIILVANLGLSPVSALVIIRNRRAYHAN